MKFKCQLSGTVVEFTTEHDIKTMLEHPQYDVVDEVKEVTHDMVQNAKIKTAPKTK